VVGLLVAEDEKNVRQGFANYLRELGYKVQMARNGQEAVSRASSPEIQIVLLDIVMPGRLDGLEAARQIQSRHPGKGIIIVSAYNNEESHQRARDIGLVDLVWVDKPSSQRDLQSLLAAIEGKVQELDERRLQEIWQSEEAQDLGEPPIPLLRLVKKIAPDLSQAVDDFTRRIISTQSEPVRRLRGTLADLRASFAESDIQERQMSFGPFKEEILGAAFWSLFERAERNHRRVAMQLRMALRKLSSLDLEEHHLAALDAILERLAREQVTDGDVRECERILRYQGIETLLDLGAQREKLLRIYREEND
jgi:CheY-like chemotaxis protein